MLKVLIADDERKVCQLIEKLVDWRAMDMEVIAVESNGIDALERIREYKPEIAITDIRMPGYDGLELIRLGKEANPRMEFIIISGYRHFEYAQTAIQYGVSAYLLKPIKKEELVRELSKIHEQFRKKTEQLTYEEQVKLTMKSDEEMLRMSFMADLVYRKNKLLLRDSLEKINQEFHYRFQPGEFCAYIIKLDGQILNDTENLKFMADKISVMMEELFGACTYDYGTYMLGSFLYFILNYDPAGRMNVRKQVRALMDEIVVQSSILEGLTVTLAAGEAGSGTEVLEASLKNARLLIEERLVAGTGRFLEGVMDTTGAFTESSLFTQFNRQMSQALESLDVSVVRDTMVALKDSMLSERTITGHEILQMTKEVCNLYLFFMKNNKIPIREDFIEDYNVGADNCASAAQLFDYLIAKITESYENAAERKKQEDNRPIRLAKQYIQKHYEEPLTLEELSAVVGLSPTYLSTVFKKDTGMTFLEYLSKVRMDMAKKLLKETNDTVAAVCRQVGYSDVRHFTKTFTKYSGLKPNEYRKLYS